ILILSQHFGFPNLILGLISVECRSRQPAPPSLFHHASLLFSLASCPLARGSLRLSNCQTFLPNDSWAHHLLSCGALLLQLPLHSDERINDGVIFSRSWRIYLTGF